MVVAGRERWWLRFAYPPYILASLRLCERKGCSFRVFRVFRGSISSTRPAPTHCVDFVVWVLFAA